MDKSQQDSAKDKECFYTSQYSGADTSGVLVSTPVSHMGSRKRKAYYVENFPSPPRTPQFSSTLNESLMEHLEKINLQNSGSSACFAKGMFEDFMEGDETGNSSPCKISKSSDSGFRSVPCTPKKQISSSRESSKRSNTSSFIKNFSQINVTSQSPLTKDAYDILYPTLKPLESPRKGLTPQKFKDRLDKTLSQAKVCLFTSSKKQLFQKIVSNPIIMQRILKQLSNGDLYRLSQVSVSLKTAILCDIEASKRFSMYMKTYFSIKENYKITPPSSPEKDEEESFSVSPSTVKHQHFWELASELNKNQHLIKCVACCKASVVENNIAYCQSVSCGYIQCRKCNSFAYNPKDFRDKCCNVQSRSLLGDLSNSSSSGYITDTTSSFMSSPSFNLNFSKSDVTGTFSEIKNSTPKQNVKRNLSKSFVGSAKRKVEIFASSNRIATPTPPKSQRKTSLVPAIPTENIPKRIEELDPTSSPPHTKQYAVGSKQSKRNLKRLTR